MIRLLTIVIISCMTASATFGVGYVDYHVTQSSDDANTYDDLNSFTTTASIVTYGNNPTFGICKDYFRFSDISVDSGATIDSAFLYLNGSFDPTFTLSTKIYFEDTDSANTYSSYADTSRSKIGTTIPWTVTASAWSVGSYNQSPDLQVPIQALINRGGWKSGNAIGIAWLQNILWKGYCTFKSYDYGSSKPYLRIYYNVSEEIPKRRRRMLTGE